MIRRSAALVGALLTLPVWVVAISGALEVRACVPAGSPLLGAQLLLLRPDRACPSGQGLSDGALVVVGTVCLLTLATSLASLAALAGLGSVLRRLAGLVLRLVDAILPRRLTSWVAPVTAAPSRVTAHVAIAVQRIFDGAVERRGPPALA